MFVYCMFFFFKQKTAYEMRISDWSSDVCSSDLALRLGLADRLAARVAQVLQLLRAHLDALARRLQPLHRRGVEFEPARGAQAFGKRGGVLAQQAGIEHGGRGVVGGRRDYRVSRRGLPPAALCQNAASPRNRSIECPRPSLRPPRVVANQFPATGVVGKGL